MGESVGAGDVGAANAVTPKKILFVLLMFVLPVDGTPLVRLRLGELDVSAVDLLLAAILYVDGLDALLAGVRIARPVATALLLSVATAVLSTVSLLWLSTAEVGYDLKLTLNLLELVVLVHLAVRIVDDRPMLRRALLALVAGTGVVAAFTWAKSAGFDLPGFVRTTARFSLGPFLVGVSGLTFAGVAFSVALLAAIPAALSKGVVRPLAARGALGLLLGFAAVLLYSRSLWIALAAQLLLLLGLAAAGAPAGGRPRARLALFAGVATVALVEGPGLLRGVIGLRPRTVVQRLSGFSHGWELAAQGPGTLLFGAGKNLFVDTVRAGEVPHNFLVDLLVSKGLLTLLAFLSLLALAAARLVRRLRAGDDDGRRLATVLLAALAGNVVLGLFAPITNSMTFLTLVALAVAFDAAEEGAAARS